MFRLARYLPSAVAALAIALQLQAQSTWYVDVNAPAPGSGTAQAPYASLQFAIDQPTTVDGDSLLVAPGVYAETIRYQGKRLRVRSTQGAAVTILDGQGLAQQVVRFVDGEPSGATLEGFTVRGARNESGPAKVGGGISCIASNAEIRDCVVESCGGQVDRYLGAAIGLDDAASVRIVRTVVRNSRTALNGGGVFARGSTLNMQDSEIRSTQALVLGGVGGGIFAEASSVNLVRTTISGCFGPSGGGLHFASCVARLDATILENCFEATGLGQGGALFSVQSDLDISRSSTRNCSAAVGAAIIGFGSRIDARDSSILDCNAESSTALRWNDGPARFERCKFEGNNASNTGSILFGKIVDTGPTATAHFIECVFENNGHYLGSMMIGRGATVLSRCVVRGNRPQGIGERMFERVTLDRCTLAHNRPYQATVATVALAVDSQLTNCIVWDNPDFQPDLPGCTVAYCDTDFPLAGVGNFSANPLFRDALNGDLRLLPGSPCIDVGDPLATVDLDGTRADLGAFAFYPDYGDPVVPYCSAKVSSAGCLPYLLSGAAPPSASSGLFEIVLRNVPPGRVCRLLWSPNAQALPFKGGTLCVLTPRRTPESLTALGPGQLGCDGVAVFPWRNLTGDIALLGAGDTVCVQYLFRDAPSSLALGLSNALSFTLAP